MQFGQARHQRWHDVRCESLKTAHGQSFRRRRRARIRLRPRVKPLWHAVGAIGVDQRRPRPRHEDVLDRSQNDEVRSDSVAAGDPAVERNQRIHHARRTGQLDGPCGAFEPFGAVRSAAPGEGIGDVRLILAQDVDAKHAVPQQRIRDRT